MRDGIFKGIFLSVNIMGKIWFNSVSHAYFTLSEDWFNKWLGIPNDHSNQNIRKTTYNIVSLEDQVVQ